MRQPVRGFPSLAPALLALTLAAALLPAPAAAHQRLLRAEPAPDATATAAPRELRLSFAEPVQLGFTQLELLDADGARVALGEARVAADSATVLVVPIAGRLRSGIHTVRWATASRDGHPVRGEYVFSIAPDAEGLAVDAAPAEAPPTHAHEPAMHHAEPGLLATAFGAASPGYVFVRWVNYLALLGVIGAVAFALAVLGFLRRRGPEFLELIRDARGRAAAVGLGFTGLLAAAALGRLYAQSLAMHGPLHALDAGRIGTLLVQTVWGWGWILQAWAIVIAGAGFLLARRRPAPGWALAAAGAVVLAVTPALSGHAAAMTGAVGRLAVAIDALHVLAAGSWLGSLLVLLLAGLPAAARSGAARRGAAAASLIHAFSPTALTFAGVLVLTGIVATVIHSGSLGALIASRYGTLLGIKLGFVAVVIGIGAYNYRRVQPALGDDAGTRRLRRTAGAELAVGAVVLLVTAVLVATARPYERPADGGADHAPAAEAPRVTQLSAEP